MAGGFRFDPNPAGIDDLAKGSPATAFALEEAAAIAAENMTRLATLSGSAFFDFRGSIDWFDARDVGGELVAYAGSDSPGWHLQEYGTSRLHPFAILRKGIKAAGIRFEEG